MQKSLRIVSNLFLKLAAVTLAVGFILRIVLLFNEQTSGLDFPFGKWMQIFLLGAVNDLCVAVFGFVFLWLFVMSISADKYRKPWGYIILGVLVAAFCYVTFFDTVFDEYGHVMSQVASGIFGFWAFTFAMRLFFSVFRRYWTTVWLALILVLCIGAIVFNGVNEFFFWNEFGVRYNFIALDYLVCTSEVSGSIWEPYPVMPMTLGILLATFAIMWYLFRRDIVRVDLLKGWKWKAVAFPAYIVLLLMAGWLLKFNLRFQQSPNADANELQANGIYKLYDAFVKNESDYTRFDTTPPDECTPSLREEE